MPTLHGGNRAAYTRLGFRDFYAFFGIFIYSFLLLARPQLLARYHIIYCIPFSAVFSCWSYVCRYAIKADRSDKNVVKLFSFPIFPPLAFVCLRSVICDQFLLIFRIRKTVFLIRVLVTVVVGVVVVVVGGGVCVKRRRDYRAPYRLIYCIRFRERHCKRFL